ncbi:hypothetical protein BJV77DRAFT_1059915 [Russula vinacea]|nr:hypothetical protein BJV77DRAFT_1059915 [Russula vinacea]
MESFSDGPSRQNQLDFPLHSSSPNDMRIHLQNLLDAKEKQLQQAAALGERLLAQRVELEERVRPLQDVEADKGDEITADMRERYRELADAVRAWDSGNAQLTSTFTSSNINGSLTSQPFELHESLRDEPERPKPAPGTLPLSLAELKMLLTHLHTRTHMRITRNSEFAFEIGSGLLTEVRRLQSLLAERDKAIQDMKEEKDDFEKNLESLRGALKLQEQSTDGRRLQHRPSTSRRRGDTSAMFSADGDYDSSPDVSPSRPFQAPNHPSNEVEALQQRLSHAQRQINTLKSTLQREKELKIEYRKRLDGSPGVSTEPNTEEYLSDEYTEDGTPGTGKKPRRLVTFRAARGGRGRGGRSGFRCAYQHTPPQVPALPVFFGGGAEADDEPEPDYQDEETSVDPPLSNRGSLDGLDPAFASVLRRSSSSGSLPYNRSPLRQAVASRSVPRRSRGGAAFQEARPASLVGQPEALAAELFGTGMDSVVEGEPITTAEFGCQTEFEEASPLPIQITPPAPETADFGIQVEQVLEPKLMVDTVTQTDPEPIPPPVPKVIIEHAEIGIQHDLIESPRLYAETSIETDPLTEHEVTPTTPSAPLSILSQAEVQTMSVPMAQTEVQTLPVSVPEKFDVETQTTHSDETITRSALPPDVSGDTTIYGGLFAAGHDQGDEELNDGATETGADTDTDADYQDARQSIIFATPTEDYESMQAFSDEDDEEGDDDAESIKASMLAYTRDAQGEESPAAIQPEFARISSPLPQITYESQAVQVEPPEEPPSTLLSTLPGPTPEPVLTVVPELPKPELKEISIQTEKWVPTPPASPAHPRTTSLLGYKAAGTGTHQFQYIAPQSASSAAPVTPTRSAPTSPSAVRDSVATIIPAPRPFSHDRRQSIESTLSGADDSTPRSRIPSVAAPAPVDKSRPPMMMLPPPPRAPPPPNSMPPPPFIPERRLIQRATTPTFGSLRGGLPRQHNSSLPTTTQGLASRPSQHSFRSAAHPTVVSIFTRDRDRSDRSLGSGRSSMSSDNHYYPARSQSRATNAPPAVNGYPQNGAVNPSTHGTDPAILHAITQTMIGEFWHGERRHKRFFWVHPYTRTLYWSDADPGSSNVSESSAKSAYIEGVRAVLDPNPLPPGLHQYSVVVSTPFREMKFTAPSKERHDIWINALQYLLTRPNGVTPSSTANGPNGPAPASFGTITGRAERRAEDHQPEHQNSQSGRSLHVSGDTWGSTPRGQRSTSQLSAGGSIGKRSGTPAAEYLRYPGPDGPYSPTKSFEHGQVGARGDEGLDFELHEESMSDHGFEGLENVRACCDARPRTRDGHLDAHADPPRPSSPAWSFRSRSGSTTSHDGGFFSGKLRFGSRRSTKTSNATSAMEVHSQHQST